MSSTRLAMPLPPFLTGRLVSQDWTLRSERPVMCWPATASSTSCSSVLTRWAASSTSEG